jgi:hypothetical protein
MAANNETKITQSLQLLNNPQNQSLARGLYHVTLSFLLNPSGFDYQGQLGDVATEFHQIPQSEFKALAQGVLVLLNDGEYTLFLTILNALISRFFLVLNNGASLEYLRKSALSLGLNAEAIQLLSLNWNAFSNKIVSHLFSKIITKNRLIDMDWSFGVTAASDDCDHVGKTYLQLKLTIEEDHNNTESTTGEQITKVGPRDIFLELTLDQFYQFLASLEKCRTFLDYVSPKST